MSFDEAKQFLRREEDSGNSLYDHLSRVLLKVIVERPTDANTLFEEISSSVRSSTFVPPSLPVEGEETAEKESKTKQLAWVAETGALFKPSTEEESGDIPPPYPDLNEEANVFEWAGVSFGKEETYRLYLAIKQLAGAEATPLKFWGKIITRSGDYYVVQGETGEEIDADKKVMEGKEGPNKYSYWVCKYPGAGWTKLPLVTPEAIVVARQIRRFFTGDLAAEVPSFPPFPGGTEAHLLRATIARITSACAISPAGFFAEGEGEDDYKSIAPVPAEEFAEGYTLTTESLKGSDSWVHHELEINVLGRCQLVPVSEEEEEAGGPEVEQPEVAQPLKPIVEDDASTNTDIKSVPEGSAAWVMRACPGGAGESPVSIVTATSQVWPGAYAMAYGKKYVNVYCGFGIKATDAPYQPPKVAPIQPEWAPAEEEEGLVEAPDKITEPEKPAEDEDE